MTTENEFLQIAQAAFQAVDAEQAQALLEKKAGDLIFIARETCPYCRKFIKRLAKTTEEHSIPAYFLHSQVDDPAQNEATQALRDRYDLKTVPSLIYQDQDGIHTVSDSSMKPEEILAFLNR